MADWCSSQTMVCPYSGTMPDGVTSVAAAQSRHKAISDNETASKWAWSFAGSMKQDRQEAINTLAEVHPHPAKTSWEIGEVSALYSASSFVPVGRGSPATSTSLWAILLYFYAQPPCTRRAMAPYAVVFDAGGTGQIVTMPSKCRMLIGVQPLYTDWCCNPLLCPIHVIRQ